MNDEQFYVKWEGRGDDPVLANGCTNTRAAALWAVDNDLPHNATVDSRISVYVASEQHGPISEVRKQPPTITYRAGQFAGEARGSNGA